MASQGNLARPSQTVALQSCIMDKWFFFRFLRVCLLFALCALVLVYVGGFPIRQGAVLGAAMALLAFGVLKLSNRRLVSFPTGCGCHPIGIRS